MSIVELVGALDERSDLEAVFAGLDGETTFRMAGIERVNSIGIHRWIPVITRLSSDHAVFIELVPYSLVLSANSVANLFGEATVLSCLAPYFCSACSADRMATVTAEEARASAPATPEKTCEVCGGHLDFDELDSYFKFLRARRWT